MKALINGTLCDATTEAGELPRTRRGVFETVLLLEGRPIFWDEHMARFAAGCRWAALDLPETPGGLLGHVVALAATNAIRTGVVRVANWRTNEGEAQWRIEVRPPRPHMSRPEYSVIAGPVLPPASPNRAYKHLDRGRWLDALRAARTAGFDETLLVDESRNAIEGAVSNVLFARGGELHTPALSQGPLPGVMRAQVLLAAKRYGVTVHEHTYRLAEVLQADEIWLTNSLIGIRPVARVADRVFASRWPVLDQFRAKWRDEFGWDPRVVCA